MSQDFENLISAPISTGYFSFKSEKNWSQIDTSKYNNLFTIDVKNLSMQYNCIAFNKYMDIDDKYFTHDQLTYLSSMADDARKIYAIEMSQSDNSLQLNVNDDITHDDDTSEEELDFLLTLKEAIDKNTSEQNQYEYINDDGTEEMAKVKELKERHSYLMDTYRSRDTTPLAIPKSDDLEIWLDSVLDD